MDHFVDIRIKPDAEMRENLLLNKVYTKLHKVLFDLQAHDIGVSFPEFRVKLGRVIRLHATSPRLQELQKLDWLGGLAGYCQISNMKTVPDHAEHRTVSRLRSNMSPAKMRRLIARGALKTDEDIKSYRAKMYSSGLDSPYLELVSTSNGQSHRRYIQFGALQKEPVIGKFDYFGLSKQATIPWF
ncbi:type I-F CRISPR-associated endoribonuclease Cas6/Csy4 [Endozoicomonas acroporae]|uniref:type I-F CRISPR-associated endoribonuclease Cas6/Csy4 n=1 Tax=Endozoicomonas acroporae TaxID=1701104 RepID=UPI003D7A1515